jgi:ferrous iron transport protein B
MALNIYDEAQAKGYRFDLEALSSMLGVTVVPTTATKGTGVKALMTAAVAAADNPGDYSPKPVPYGDDIERAVDEIVGGLRRERPEVFEEYPPRWLAHEVMESDQAVPVGSDCRPETKS